MKSPKAASASKFCEVKTKGTLMLQQNEVSRAVENYGDFVCLLDEAEDKKINPLSFLRRIMRSGLPVYGNLKSVPLPSKLKPTASEIQEELDKGNIEIGIWGEVWRQSDSSDEESSYITADIFLPKVELIRLPSSTLEMLLQSKGWIEVKPLIISRNDFCRLVPKEVDTLAEDCEFVQIRPEMTPILSLHNIWLPSENSRKNQKTTSDQINKSVSLESFATDALDNLLIKIHSDLMEDRSDEENPINQQIWNALKRELGRNKRKYDKENILKELTGGSVLLWSETTIMRRCSLKTLKNRMAKIRKKGLLSERPAGTTVER